MEDKLKDKLLKLYELAKRGVDGEKISAELLLNKMLAKHGFTIEDINTEISKIRCYRYTTKLNRKLIGQITSKVLNNSNAQFNTYYKEVLIEATDYQHIQILELIDFHLDNYNKERKQFIDDFTSAYVQKHRLFRDATDEDYKESKPLTTEEKQSIWRMTNIKNCLSNKSYIKKLN